MELPDFIEELEQAITHAGSDQVWKRQVGDKMLWFSPMTFVGQEKTNESLTNAELGVNVVFESKRVTLCHAIVGIGELDFRPWREGAAVFPSVNKEGKKVKVRLEEYLYEKMKAWGGQYIDDVFRVYADLLESHQKDNLKEIRFENAKDPRLELMELEARAAELRNQIGMPPMVEQGSPAARGSSEDETAVEECPEAPQEAAAQGSGKEKPPVPDDPDFDPFHPVRNDGLPKHVREAEAARNGGRRAPAPSSVQRPYVPAEGPPRAQGVPTAPDPAQAQPALVPEDELFVAPRGQPAPPAVPIPPANPDEVLEIPAERKQVPPPRIDPVAQNINPRFARPAR